MKHGLAHGERMHILQVSTMLLRQTFQLSLTRSSWTAALRCTQKQPHQVHTRTCSSRAATPAAPAPAANASGVSPPAFTARTASVLPNATCSTQVVHWLINTIAHSSHTTAFETSEDCVQYMLHA